MAVPALVTVAELSKRYSSQALFSNLSFTINEQDRLGIIGPNGAGKSTLLKIIAGVEEQDSGSIIRKRGARIVYITQEAEFTENESALEHIYRAAKLVAMNEADALDQTRRAILDLRIKDENALVSTLSGGQRKRVQIACGLAQNPDLFLLDEPTNHLDIGSIIALESLLSEASFSWAAISHDRWFLENAVSRIAEVNPRYPAGVFVCDGSYSEYRQRSADFLSSEQSRRESLENKVRNEKAWLSRGPKARATKAKGRIDKAYQMMETLSLAKARARERKVNLAFNSSERETKKLVEFTNVEMRYEDKVILKKLNLKLLGGQTLGVLGRNGTGKSTFVKLLAKDLEPVTGTIKHATNLQVAHFKQIDESIDPITPLKEVLAEDSDSVVYAGRAVHVSSWASRFGFSFAQLSQPFGSLSGGEKARARIAQIMLKTPDILILDEPTNDLDIQTLEMLETSLSEFEGALVVVTHDRFMINRLCESFLGLDGKGNATVYSEYEQWEREVILAEDEEVVEATPKATGDKTSTKKLPYKEQKEYNSMAEKITKAEKMVEEVEAKLSDPSIYTDSSKTKVLFAEFEVAKKNVDTLYARWEELDAKLKGE
jgi:ATP-binding cassette subfamily F protein uup